VRQLEHVEFAIRNFVSRELLRLLELCPVWQDYSLECGEIHPSSNSFIVRVHCKQLGEQPFELLFQEQSGWVVAGMASPGFLRFASADQLRSLQHALEGFYRKCGIDMVREQMENEFLKGHPYDINSEGLSIWPHGQFRQELKIDLSRKGMLKPVPADQAAVAGLHAIDRSQVLFFESRTLWDDWVNAGPATTACALPMACTAPTKHVLLGRVD
jgi:hypothetical protein